jgi:hypothetical protein
MRWLQLMLAGLLAAVVFAASCLASAPTKPEPTLRDVIERLEQLAARLDQLEQRLARLEQALALQAKPDKYGVLRDVLGRPVGIWGIDAPGVSQGRDHGFSGRADDPRAWH